MNTPNNTEQAAVVTWLSRRAGVSREQSQTLPADIIELLASSPRQGLERLFTHLNRKRPAEGKLNMQARELSSAIESARSDIAQRIAKQTTTGWSERPEIEKEGRLDHLITDVEGSFLAFESRLRECANQTHMPSYLRPEELYSPFEAVRLNQSNGQRNMVRRRRQIASGETSSTIALGNPYQFFYDLQEGREQGGGNVEGAASFSPVMRIMSLPPKHDPQSVLRLLIQYHEMRHANQDASRRIAMMGNPAALQAYIDFHTGKGNEKPRIVVTEEASAYGYEMEALNVLLKDRLQNGTPSAAVVMKELGCKQEERPNVETLLHIARHYFPEGMNGGGFSQRFIDFMRDVHIDLGYDVFVPTTSGRLKQLTKTM
jgi:hypothetical protein